MVYTKQLPKADNLSRLAESAGPFPITAGNLAQKAKSMKFNKSMQDFLRQFPDDEVFESRADFVLRSEELEMLFREERDMPNEVLRSPQDMSGFWRKDNDESTT